MQFKTNKMEELKEKMIAAFKKGKQEKGYEHVHGINVSYFVYKSVLTDGDHLKFRESEQYDTSNSIDLDMYDYTGKLLYTCIISHDEYQDLLKPFKEIYSAEENHKRNIARHILDKFLQ